MTPSLYETIEERYHAYVGRFKIRGEMDSITQLKYDHSLQVARDAEDLSRTMGWNEEATAISKLTGLLHDVGRFSQISEYGTLSDKNSLNHGELGYRILIQELMLDGLSPHAQIPILDGVRYHNAWEIPACVGASSLRYVQLVRDADKLDIYRVMFRALSTGKLKTHPELLVTAMADGQATPALVDKVTSNKGLSIHEVRNVTDYFLLQLSWVYTINFTATLKRLTQERSLENIRDFFYEDHGLAAAAKIVIGCRDFRLAQTS